MNKYNVQGVYEDHSPSLDFRKNKSVSFWAYFYAFVNFVCTRKFHHLIKTQGLVGLLKKREYKPPQFKYLHKITTMVVLGVLNENPRQNGVP